MALTGEQIIIKYGIFIHKTLFGNKKEQSTATTYMYRVCDISQTQKITYYRTKFL